jgi:hypothetical protein
MRIKNGQGRFNWLLLIPAMAIVVSGCGEKSLPEPSYPGASRDLMENPLGAAAKAKAADAKVSAKANTARQNAAKADPRGK